MACVLGSAIVLSACGSQSVTVSALEPGAAVPTDDAGQDGAAADPEAPQADEDPAPVDEPAEPTEAEAEAVAEVVAEVEASLSDEPSGEDDETLDSLDEPLDEEVSTVEVDEARDEREEARPEQAEARNESGEPNRLDEAAGLACAEVERALTALDEGDPAAAAASVAAASDWAAQSSNGDVAAWSAPLAESSTAVDDDISTIIGFLSVCTEGGYEL